MSEKRITQIAEQQQEGLTGYIGAISSDHAYIHDGLGFAIIETLAAVASGATVYIGLTTPNAASGKFVHFRPTSLTSTDSGVVAKIYEDLSYTNGTACNCFNMNRLSSNTAALTGAVGVTATPSTELVIAAASVGSGGNPVTSSGGIGGSADNERVLKQDTSYVVELKNIGAATTTINVSIFWYEESQGLDV